MFCSGCGNEVKDDIAFCDKCGTPVSANNQNMVNAGAANNQKPVSTNAGMTKKVRNKNVPIIIAMIAVVLIAVIVIVVVLASNKNKKSSGNDSSTNSSSKSSGSKSGKSLTEYSGKVYEELGLSPSFYNVIDEAPTIDTRVLRGAYSSNVYGNWIFDMQFENDYGQAAIGSTTSLIFETEYSSYENIYAEMYVGAINFSDGTELSVRVGKLNEYSMTYPNGEVYRDYSVYTVSDGFECSTNNLLVIFGDSLIDSEELNGNYSEMTYTEIVDKFKSIGFFTNFCYMKGWEDIGIAWYCPDENKFLVISFNPVTEEVKETKIYTTSGVQCGEIEYSDEYYKGCDFVQEIYDTICPDGYSAFKANDGDLYESVVYIYGLVDEDAGMLIVGPLDTALEAYEAYDGDLSSCAGDVEEIGRIKEGDY